MSHADKLNRLLAHYESFTGEPRFTALVKELKLIVAEADQEVINYKSKLLVSIVSGALGIIILAVSFFGR